MIIPFLDIFTDFFGILHQRCTHSLWKKKFFIFRDFFYHDLNCENFSNKHTGFDDFIIHFFKEEKNMFKICFI